MINENNISFDYCNFHPILSILHIPSWDGYSASDN